MDGNDDQSCASHTPAPMCVQWRHLLVSLACVQLVSCSTMENPDTAANCQSLICENNNACTSMIVNGSLAGRARCLCRGQWAGPRCERRIHVTTESVTSQRVTMEIKGSKKDEEKTGNDKLVKIHMQHVTVAVWNLNISDQCLLLHRKSVENSIVLDGLERDQEYTVCVANGFVDFCSVFGYSVEALEQTSNCVTFETKETDELPKLGIILVSCAIAIFVLILVIFFYKIRKSLLVQLCLHVCCCKKCQVCRKMMGQGRQPMRKQRGQNGDILLTSHSGADMEDLGESTHESSLLHSSAPHMATVSRDQAFYSEADWSAPGFSSVNQNGFLYEDQTLVTPLYSPVDHKILTLSYLGDDLTPMCVQHSVRPPVHGDTWDGTRHDMGVAWEHDRELTNPYRDMKADRHMSNRPRPRRTHSHMSYTGDDVRMRELRRARIRRQRPNSLPYTLMYGQDHLNYLSQVGMGPPPFRRPQPINTFTHTQAGILASPVGEVPFLNFDLNHDLQSSAPRAWYRLPPLPSSPPVLRPTDNRYEGQGSGYNTLPRAKKPSSVVNFNDANVDCSYQSLPRRSRSPLTSELSLGPISSQQPTVLDNSSQHGQAPQPAVRPTSLSRASGRRVKTLISQFENSLPFGKGSRPSKVTEEEQEFRTLQSPLAEDRGKKKSRPSSFSKSLSRKSSTRVATPTEEVAGQNRDPIFAGHPADHMLLPFSTDDDGGDDDNNDKDNVDDDKGISAIDDKEEETVAGEDSLVSLISQSGDSVISSFAEDSRNLVTPFYTEDSSDDETFNDIASLCSAGSSDTLH